MAQNATLISDRLKSAAADEAVPFRQAPHNLEAEQALLGAILVNNEAMDRVSVVPGAAPLLRSAAPADLRDGGEAHPRRQERDADHAAHVLREGRADLAQPDGAAVPRHARRQRDHHHQRRGLRPHRLRPRHAPRAHHHRRGHGQRAPTTAPSTSRRRRRSRKPRRGSTISPSSASTARASWASAPRSPTPSTWRTPPTSARATSRVSRPA